MLKGNSVAEKIWNYLIDHGLTPCGAAGLMGNLKAESGLISNRVEILCLKRLRENGKAYTDETYTATVDCGTISREQFLHPLPGRQYGYGIAQWTSPGRKAGLYDLCKRRGVSIGDLETQLIWLLSELTVSYRKVLSVLKGACTVKEASDYVLCNFEQPDDCGASVRNYRASLGQKYYDAYNKTEVEEMGVRQKVVDLVNSQESNVGGKKYWSWWGYASRVPWCQIFVSWIMEQAGVPISVYGKYENCQYAIEQMQKKGIWHTNGYRPQPGDICYYDWGKDGVSDHVGIVVAVNGDQVTVREGNKSDAVGNRISPYNSPQIVGYASPDYEKTGNQENQTGGRYMFSVGTVQKGSAGNDVKLLQELLCYHGYGLAVDGDFGTLTRSAAMEYQKRHGLGVDGIVGPKTWKSILLR